MKKLIIGIILFIGLTAISWAIVCGMVYLISLCFGFTYSWAIATGVWLVMILIKSLLPSKKE